MAPGPSATAPARGAADPQSDDLLLLVEERGAEGAPSGPPRTWIYRIDALTNEQATLTEFWTGWGNLQDVTIDYRIKRVSQAGRQPIHYEALAELSPQGGRHCSIQSGPGRATALATRCEPEHRRR